MICVLLLFFSRKLKKHWLTFLVIIRTRCSSNSLPRCVLSQASFTCPLKYFMICTFTTTFLFCPFTDFHLVFSQKLWWSVLSQPIFIVHLKINDRLTSHNLLSQSVRVSMYTRAKSWANVWIVWAISFFTLCIFLFTQLKFSHGWPLTEHLI